MSIVASLSITDCLNELCSNNSEVSIKWPNDILVNGCKIGGILLELLGNKISIGVGINIYSSPTGINCSTINLKDLGYNILSIDFMELYLSRFREWHRAVLQQDFSIILSIWKSRIKGIGDNICVRTFNKSYNGKFIGINSLGNLLLKQLDDEILTFNIGEVFFS